MAMMTLASYAQVPKPPQQYPIADALADKIVTKYQTSSCAQLAAQKAEKSAAAKSPMEMRVVELMRKDAAMREHFLNRIAGPVVNKLFECGMVP